LSLLEVRFLISESSCFYKLRPPTNWIEFELNGRRRGTATTTSPLFRFPLSARPTGRRRLFFPLSRALVAGAGRKILAAAPVVVVAMMNDERQPGQNDDDGSKRQRRQTDGGANPDVCLSKLRSAEPAARDRLQFLLSRNGARASLQTSTINQRTDPPCSFRPSATANKKKTSNNANNGTTMAEQRSGIEKPVSRKGGCGPGRGPCARTVARFAGRGEEMEMERDCHNPLLYKIDRSIVRKRNNK